MKQKTRKSDFNKNFITLLTGTSIATALPILISPVLTRIYSPEDFGVLALFIALSSIFGAIANGRYELAIILPDKDEEAINIVALSLWISSFVSIGLFCIIIVFYEAITTLIGNEQIGIWLYFVPLVVFMIGLFNSLNYLNTRMKTYKTLAKVNVYRALITSLLQIGIGIIKPGAFGLLMGNIVSHFVSITKLTSVIIKEKKLLSAVNRKEIFKFSRTYSSFPKYSMPAVLANNISQRSLNFFLPIMFSFSTLGFYSIVERILATPSAVIGGSMGQVFFQHASEEKRAHGNIVKVFNATLKKLIFISILPFALIYLFAEPVVVIVFGEEWQEVGVYTKILAPYFLLRFINTPLSTVTSIFKKNHVALIMQTTYLILTLIVLLLSYRLQLEIQSFLILYSITFSIYNLFRLAVFRKISRGQRI